MLQIKSIELVSNEGKGEFEKQDCEQEGLKRLGAQVYKTYPNRPICIHLDGLYATAPIMAMSETYGRKYITTRKDGNLKKLNEQIVDKQESEKVSFTYPHKLNPGQRKPVYGNVQYLWVDEFYH